MSGSISETKEPRLSPDPNRYYYVLGYVNALRGYAAVPIEEAYKEGEESYDEMRDRDNHG